MQTLRLLGTLCGLFLVVTLTPLQTLAAPNAVFVVDSTADASDDNLTDNLCHTAANTCTLRAALEQANHDAVTDQISFSIGIGGVQTITPQTALPQITETVEIDGTTQPNCSSYPCIEINGQAVGTDGLWVAADNSIIRGLVINRFGELGIRLSNTFNAAVVGSYIGTDLTGTQARPNQSGGIYIADGSDNRIGGTVEADRNLISGNQIDGITIYSNGNNEVLGNFIGTDITGTHALPNKRNGVLVFQSENAFIGGVTPGAGNVISGNKKSGVAISGGDTNNVLGNYIGVDITGIQPLRNKANGITLGHATANNIGGWVPEAANVIAGNNGNGIFLSASTYNIILGNAIGTDTSGTHNLGNGKRGIGFFASDFNLVGSTASGAANQIRYNKDAGIFVDTNSERNALRQNEIDHNQALGIDLETIGVTPNDGNDADTGANALLNFPILKRAKSATQIVKFKLISKPNKLMTLDFFAGACDSSGYGEGKTFLGTTAVQTNSSGKVRAQYQAVVPFQANQAITATTTDELGNTSEFSKCVTAN